jgi:hypothetical protein
LEIQFVYGDGACGKMVKFMIQNLKNIAATILEGAKLNVRGYIGFSMLSRFRLPIKVK